MVQREGLQRQPLRVIAFYGIPLECWSGCAPLWQSS
jgi:hypothetical protein